MKDLQITMMPDGWMEKTGGYAKDMTLRDYFAAKAMPTVIADWLKTGDIHPDPEIAEVIARDCYIVADAMLEAGK